MVTLLGLVSGCGGSKVTEATCNACGSASYSAAACEAWGEEAGCETSSFFAGGQSNGCRNGCSFENCDRAPPCGEATGPVDAPDASPDAAVDPRCQGSQDGLFSSNPPCDGANAFSLNGATFHYCPCSESCPCGYLCGSIPLSVGGSIGTACAPP